MTFDEVYERLCVGCLKEKICHDSGTECDFVSGLKEALEKRIPALVKDFHCPACGNAVSSKKKDGKYIMEYCKACGQALKWGE